MPKNQCSNRKVRLSLEELHCPPPLGPNQYFYITECIMNCGSQDCGPNCETRSIPYRGQKEFYVKDHNGIVATKWAEKYYFDSTPNQFERLWANTRPGYINSLYPGIPEIPQGGWCEYKPEEKEKEYKYHLLYWDYNQRQAERQRENQRKIAEAFQQREENYRGRRLEKSRRN